MEKHVTNNLHFLRKNKIKYFCKNYPKFQVLSFLSYFKKSCLQTKLIYFKTGLKRVHSLRAFQCNAMKLQICTKIININPYMLLNTSEFFKIYVYDLFFWRNKKMKIALFNTGSYGITYKNVHFSPSYFSKLKSVVNVYF